MAHAHLISFLSVGALALGTSAAAPVNALALSSGSSLSSGSTGPLTPDWSTSSGRFSSFLGQSSQALEIGHPDYPEIYRDTTQQLEVPVPGYGTRDVLISLPEDYDPSQSYPVWLAYPGRNITPEHMSADTGLQVSSDAIVAYARGNGGAFAGAPYSVTTMEEDIAYSRAIVDRIGQDFAIDRERVYAIGHSNGGGFSLALACFAPDLVAGVSAASGIYYDPGTPETGECVGEPVPVSIQHSSNDGLSWIDGGSAHGEPYVGARKMAQMWAGINGCGDRTHTRPAAPGVTAHVHEDCDAETQFVLAGNDGHGWPHYSAFVAWDFLSRQ